MKIHFCDLCNESVPQADIDQGRASLRKGRVVCAACERAMSHHEPNDAPRVAPGTLDPSGRTVIWPAGQASAGQGMDQPAPEQYPAQYQASQFPSEADANEPPPVLASTPPIHSAHHPHTPLHAAQSRVSSSSSGLWVGLLGLAFTAGAVLVLDERMKGIETRSQELATSLDERAREVAVAQRNVIAAKEEQREMERKATLRFDTEKARREDLGNELSRLRMDNSEMAQKLVALQALAASLEQKSGSGSFDTQKRLDEMSARLAKGEDDARILAEKMAVLEAATPAVAVGEPAKPEQPAVPEVAWHAHVAGLKSDSPSTRWEAVTTLGATKDPETVPHIAPMLKDPDIFVRMAAARVLGDMQAKGGVSALIDALEDVETAVREAANIALRTITGKDFKFDPLAIEAERARRVKSWREWWKKEGEGPSGS